MNLFEISQDFRNAFDALEALYEEDESPEQQEMLSAAWDTIEGVEGDMKQKIENTVLYIRELEAEADGIDQQIKRMKVRSDAKKNTAKNLKEYILSAMQLTDTKIIETPSCKVSIRSNPESVILTGPETELLAWAVSNGRSDLYTVKEPEISKTGIKKALKNGDEIPFAALERTQSLNIK